MIRDKTRQHIYSDVINENSEIQDKFGNMIYERNPRSCRELCHDISEKVRSETIETVILITIITFFYLVLQNATIFSSYIAF